MNTAKHNIEMIESIINPLSKGRPTRALCREICNAQQKISNITRTQIALRRFQTQEADRLGLPHPKGDIALPDSATFTIIAVPEPTRDSQNGKRKPAAGKKK